MSKALIAERYAKALFGLDGLDKTKVHEVLSEIAGLIAQDQMFKEFVQNPLLSFEEQEKVIQACFAGRIPGEVIRFLLFLARKGRLDLLKEVTVAFEAQYVQGQGQAKVLIQSAYPMEEEMKAMIIDKLKAITHKSIIASYAVDPSMIGGMRVYAEGRLYEYNFKNEFQDYKRKALQRI